MENDRKLSIVMLGLKGLPVGQDGGGVERHVEELATRLVARGHCVTAYVRPRFASVAETVYHGIHVRRLPAIQTRRLDTFTHTLVGSFAALRENADIIHYHGVGPSTLAWIPRLFKPRARVVATVHALDRLHEKWGWFARAYLHLGERAAVTFPHGTIAVSRGLQEYLKLAYGADATYIPNGADRPGPVGHGLLGQWGLKPGGYIVTVARLIRLKGIHHLINAFDGFEAEKKLVIVGASEPGSEYDAYLRRLSEGNSAIIFTGFQSGEALRQLVANAYLYVHPSEAEGLALTIIEAMAAARCVLVSDIPQNLEPIDHSGITFVNADADDLRAKLRMLLNHPEIVSERGEKGRSWVAAEYDWERIVDQTEAFYRKLLDAAGPRA